VQGVVIVTGIVYGGVGSIIYSLIPSENRPIKSPANLLAII